VARRSGRVALIIASVLLALGTAVGGITVTGAKVAALAGIVLAGSIPFTAAGFLIALLVPVRYLHWVVLGGFPVLMLAAAWITFVRRKMRA